MGAYSRRLETNIYGSSRAGGYNQERELLKQANDNAVVELKEKGVTFHDIDVESLQNAYRELAASKGFQFDEEWQAAIDQTIAENP